MMVFIYTDELVTPRTEDDGTVQCLSLIYHAVHRLSAGSRHPQWGTKGRFVGGPE